MRKILCASALLALAACASTAEPASDLAAFPPLPAPSEAELAAAPELALTQSPWTQRPGPADYLAAYPRRALENGVDGTVQLDCIVREDQRVACAVRGETPQAYGFGNAAHALSGKVMVTTTLETGAPTAGGLLHWEVQFAASGRRVVTPNDGPHAGP